MSVASQHGRRRLNNSTFRHDDEYFELGGYSGGKYSRSHCCTRFYRRISNRRLKWAAIITFIVLLLLLLFKSKSTSGALRGPRKNRKTDFKVMVYNVWNFNDGEQWERRSEMIVKFIKQEDPDFICFNEVREKIIIGDQTPETSMYLRLGLLLGGNYSGGYNVGMEYKEQGVREGVAFYTKLKFKEYIPKIWPRKYPNPTDGNDRQIIRIPVQIENIQGVKEEFNFLITHFSYQLYDQYFNANDVISFLEEQNIDPSDSKILLMGDLNVVTPDTKISDSQCRFQGYSLSECPRGNLAPIEILYSSKYQFKDSWEQVGQSTDESTSFTFCNCKIVSSQQSQCSSVGRIDRILGTPNINFISTSVGGHYDSFKLCPSDHLYYTTVFTL